ncbi:serine/threonine-protein kinase BSK5-like [Bidens hawaiensis]|uniref:serine/threonine-protein kinase BSK5-like n=1 Tax=Bidens hawaiensis TaxID=980011 RepID=UPI00404B51C6
MSSLPYAQACHLFSFDEIKSATQNFSENLVIGEGGFGKVYKATVSCENGEAFIVAVKRLNRSSNQGATEFWAEIKMLTKLRHCNLVSLIGYCNDNSEMILIYDYISNGSLYHHLHIYGTNLSWLQRLKISIGAARGLEYLHTGAHTRHGIIHRDVKSFNILLDGVYDAKVSDFGLSKLCPTNESNTQVSADGNGTLGYIDPEYFLTYQLTIKSDVFAFGVVLFELLCGRVALDNNLVTDKRLLSQWANKAIKKSKVHSIIDRKIKSQISPKCLTEFVHIAHRCVNHKSKKRPNMAETVAALQRSLTLQNEFDNPVKPDSRILAFAKKLKWPFITHEVNSENGGGESDTLNLPAFKEYTLDQLRDATAGFSVENIVSGHDKEAPNVVYKGKLEDHDRLIAVKRFSTSAWPDARQFLDEAKAVGQLRSERLANLLGCCFEGNSRFLVEEYMPHESLTKHLLHWEGQPLIWAMRFQVALFLAQALDYCSSKGRPLYHYLNLNRILFDLEYTPRLSCFGLINYRQDGKIYKDNYDFIPLEYSGTGTATAEGVIYSFGTILLNLLRGDHIHPSDALRLMKGKSFQIDSCLGRCFINDDEATELLRIALRCVQPEPKERPNFKSIVVAITAIQKQTNVSARTGKKKCPSPLGDACSKMDLTAIHKILNNIGYSGDELVTDELSSQMLTREVEDALNIKANGDKAFQANDFTVAIQCYTSLIKNETARIASSTSFFRIVTQTMYVRRCYSYVMISKAQEALEDARQAELMHPGWSTALYLKAVALFCLGMGKDADAVFKMARFRENPYSHRCAFQAGPS